MWSDHRGNFPTSRLLRLVRRSIPALAIVVLPGRAQGQTERPPVLVEDFSDGLEGWEEQRLDRRSTEFRVLRTNGDPALAARSDDSAGTLVLRLPTVLFQRPTYSGHFFG